MDQQFNTISIMGEDDSIAIEWVKRYNDPDIQRAWKILEAYFNKCQDNLLSLSTDDSPFVYYTKDKVYQNVKEIINKPYFKEKIISAFRDSNIRINGEEITEQTLDTLIGNKDNNSREEDWVITKANRLYNMYLKLGHSARITYLANYSLDNILVRDPNLKDNEQFMLFHRTALLSALLHDVGRFYQAAKYDGFEDGVMKAHEDSIEGEQVDHAIAGYYYSLASALTFHEKGDSEEEKKYLISEAIAAVVVKCHQISNSKMPYFDHDGDAKELYDLNFDELHNFILNAYRNSRIMATFEQKQVIQDTVQELEKMVLHSHIDAAETEGFSYNQEYIFDVYERLRKGIEDVLFGIDQNPKTMIDQIVSIMNDTIEELTNAGEKISAEDVSNQVNLFREMANYDVALTIQNMFIQDKEVKAIPDSIRYFIITALSMTTDVDKIDIFNQRANGTYPNATSYQINEIYIFPTLDGKELSESGSLLELLNTYFGFEFDLDSIDKGFVLDNKVLRVLSLCNPMIKNMITSKFGEEVLNGDNAFFIEKDGFRRIGKTETGEYVQLDSKRENNEVFKMLTTSWLNYVVDNTDIIEDKKTYSTPKQIKESYSGTFRLGVPVDVLDENLSNLSEEEKLSRIKGLLFSKDLNRRFMVEEDNPPGIKWINMANDTDHIVFNPIHALLWQMNQFVMVNIRSRDSLQFLQEFEMLDKVHSALKDDLFKGLTRGYIDYCNEFISHVLTDSKEQGKNTFSGEYMQKRRDAVKEKQEFLLDLNGPQSTK